MAAQLIQKRGRVLSSLTNAKTFIESIDRIKPTLEQLEVRSTKLDQLWTEFFVIEDQLMLLPEQVSKASEFESTFFVVLAAYQKEVKQLTTTTRGEDSGDLLNTTMNNLLTQQRAFFETTMSNHNTELKVPRIHIEPFSGDFKQWPSFKDLYLAAVHNNSNLTSIHKFQLLRGLLRGSAAQLIKHLLLTDANYLEAWNKLIERFDKKKSIVNALIKSFMEIPSCQQPSTKALRSAIEVTDEILRGLKALGNESETRDPWIIYMLLNKLDDETKQQWAINSVENDNPSESAFMKFLNHRCEALESCNMNIRRLPFQKTVHAAVVLTNCICCSKPHPLFKCFKFRAYDINTRRNFVRERNLCFNCLSSVHPVTNCSSLRKCNICNGEHNTLLHLASDTSDPKALSTHLEISHESSADLAHNIITNTHITKGSPENKFTCKVTVLPTIIVAVPDKNHNLHTIRALLDSGSEASFITERSANALQLERQQSSISVKGLSSVSAGRTKGTINVLLCSKYDSKISVPLNALVLPRLTSKLPSKTFALNQNELEQLATLQLADPSFYESNEIDMILGIDVFFKIFQTNKITINSDLQVYDTMFGWVVGGYITNNGDMEVNCNNAVVSNDEIFEIIRRFWEVEELHYEVKPLEEDVQCENLYTKTSHYQNGRYIVNLPIKDTVGNLGSSLSNSIRRLMSMERKFEKQPELKTEYACFMREYETLGHMIRIPDDQIFQPTKTIVYLPHHAIFKQTSSTTKLRVVFDGSAGTSTGVSLNNIMFTGPKLQQDLFTILLKFRTHQVAMISDIEKMYRQVKVNQQNWDMQRIVWREKTSDRIKHFWLTTVTYGLTCSAFLAIRTLHQVAQDNHIQYPDACKIIKNDFYVDDLLSGAETEEDALNLQRDLTFILESAGFNLRKWSSNSQGFMKAIPKQNRGKDSITIQDHETFVRTLGVCWLPNDDCFTFQVPEPITFKLTKRKLLSETGKIFDPLGWLSPTTIKLKIMLQSIWLIKTDWDDPLPREIVDDWMVIKSELSLLSQVRMPRYVPTQNKPLIQYHGFCDSSEKAYAAAIYVRFMDSNNQVQSRLICAKTKVAPLKQLSLPRLELCGAVLLAKLFKKIITIFNIDQNNLYAWTDSTVVLGWLSDEPRKWNCFVGNRVSYILEQISRRNWYHVPTSSNPADCSSRGISPKILVDHNIWWRGPDWLLLSPESWPKQQDEVLLSTEVEKRKTSLHAQIKQVEPTLIGQIVERFSHYSKIIRILGQCFRFADIIRGKKTPYITITHHQSAERVLMKWVQHESFSDDIERIKFTIPLSKSSRIVSLMPFLDCQGLLRVGGRIDNANIPYSAKHPLILPKFHPVTDKLVYHLHHIYLHPNPSTLFFISRARYWIIGAKANFKRMSNQCPKCIRTRITFFNQSMGNLPIPRVTFTRVFDNTGIDYAGPVTLSHKKGRGAKRTKSYICIFICMATKAIHLELVSELTTDAFLATLRRFTSRRGLPSNIYSDNGTNFIGAKRKIDEFYHVITSNEHNSKITEALAEKSVKWHTIPPSAPHFGGLWEAGVKSFKTHLRRVIGNAAPTMEEYITLLCQIEAILNSRPLTPVSDDINDLDVLTPAHFLIGRSLQEVPNTHQGVNITLRNRWEILQNMSRGFWIRWHKEYLHSLQIRSKWQHQQNNIKIGELVLIKESNQSPLSWPKGRVIKLHPGTDNLVRVVTLKTNNGEIKRPITRLCKLMSNS